MATKKNQEVIEVKSSAPATVGGLTPVTNADVEAMKNQRDLLRKFVSSQLTEANFSDKNSPAFGEGDYGVIPGTKKRCLLKQGAEKIQKLFRLGCRFHLVDKTIDKEANFAMFIYRAEVYSIGSGAVIADCEASANSQEVKYKERTVWRKNAKGVSESTKEETPVFDVLNTLMKMAQKRALIGATLLATGASEYFTQDLLEPDDVQPPVQPPAQEQPGSPAQEQAPPAEQAPDCCGRPMMVSKYPNRETGAFDWYCFKCRASKPRA